MLFWILRLRIGSLAPEPVSLMPEEYRDRLGLYEMSANWWAENAVVWADFMPAQYQEALAESR